MNYYPFHIGDYTAHTARLSLMEDLAYRRLIDAYYLAERPFNGCSTDVAREIGMMDQIESVNYVLGKFFQQTETGFSHERCDLEIAIFREKQAKASAAGKASAQQRLNKRSTSVGKKSTDVEKSSTDVQLTNNQEPITNTSVSKDTDGEPSNAELTRAELWKAGKSILHQQGMPQTQCGSFVGKLVKDYGEEIVVEAVRAAVVAQPADAAQYIKAACQYASGQRSNKKPGKHTGFDQLDYHEGVTADGALA